jgi:hypothetical protein
VPNGGGGGRGCTGAHFIGRGGEVRRQGGGGRGQRWWPMVDDLKASVSEEPS